MVEDLCTTEQEDGGGGGRKSMFAVVLEEMKKELYPGSAYSRFSFVVKLLHIKSFYRISNLAFTVILKLLSSTFPDCSLPSLYREAKNLIHWALDMIQFMCSRTIVFYFERIMPKKMNAQYVVNQDEKIKMEKRRFLIMY